MGTGWGQAKVKQTGAATAAEAAVRASKQGSSAQATIRLFVFGGAGLECCGRKSTSSSVAADQLGGALLHE